MCVLCVCVDVCIFVNVGEKVVGETLCSNVRGK